MALLDVAVQAGIVNLLLDLRERLGLAMLFISHDLGVIQHVSDRIAVMYLGRVVKGAPTEAIFDDPRHPYTRALLEELLRLDGVKRRFAPIRGELPLSLDPPPGCHFHPRCPRAAARCRTKAPALHGISRGHAAACHFADDPLTPEGGTARPTTSQRNRCC